MIRRLFFGVNENTVLHIAVEQNDHEKIKAVLERDVRLLCKVNRTAQTPLIMACVKNDVKLVDLLLSYYRIAQEKKIPEVDINQISVRSGEHLLHVICRLQNIADSILKNILDFPGINVKIKNNDDTTPLHYFCERNPSVYCEEIGYIFLFAFFPASNSLKKIIESTLTYLRKKFFEVGADVNALTKFNETPLHKSIFNNKVLPYVFTLQLSTTFLSFFEFHFHFL